MYLSRPAIMHREKQKMPLWWKHIDLEFLIIRHNTHLTMNNNKITLWYVS
jgi:hypothetical protein